MENLRFGNKEEHSDEDIWELCRMLGMDEQIIGQADMTVGQMGQRLALSQRITVCIARALLSSVDFLLISNTLDGLPLEHAAKCVHILHLMVSNRGLNCLSCDMNVPIAFRKMKTVFLITSKPEIEGLVDACVECANIHGYAKDAPNLSVPQEVDEEVSVAWSDHQEGAEQVMLDLAPTKA